ncbi:hypothetical protein SAMN06269185_2213 [Natronoarchaeum philippinense]|uniref:Uncharacterized protein n=1 Tax=Natronoarchaeum philippinense TaxID=558529 RepID=A0A285NWR0_NATPI|nr:hypothetical protein [Natronoarchaeum philippinense]SNZ13477.1 hypothetical protein SAMN06269185_2213 [Natronoarchaeum philippinense]
MASHPRLRSTDDVTHWCGNVFEAFALTVGDAVACHEVLDDADVGTVDGLVRAARSHPCTFPNPIAFVRGTLLASARGVDAPARYWANAPEVHLDSLFAPFDCRVTVEWRDDDTRRILLEDADGTEFRTTVTYPETPLGRDNYPVLLAAVNRDLLDGTGVELVLLAGPADRWQYALGETAALDKLRSRYGETVQFGNRQLLADNQPSAYVPEGDGDVPTPDWALDGADDTDKQSPRSSDVSFAQLAERIERSAESFDDVDPADGNADTSASERTATSGNVETLLSDLSDVWPPGVPTTDIIEPNSDSTPMLGAAAADPERVDDATPIDDLFDGIEREVTSQSRESGDDADRCRQSDCAATLDDISDQHDAFRTSDDRSDTADRS